MNCPVCDKPIEGVAMEVQPTNLLMYSFFTHPECWPKFAAGCGYSTIATPRRIEKSLMETK